MLHAIAYAPEDALGGRFLETPLESAVTAFTTSAFSLKTLAVALAELYPPEGASIVGLDFDASVAWPVYDWMGVAKAALESIARYLARDLGPRGVRVNLVSAGPLGTIAARGIPGFGDLADIWGREAPHRWDTADAGPVAAAVLFLPSDLARAITAEILHVDGGFHAMGAHQRRLARDSRDGADGRLETGGPMSHPADNGTMTGQRWICESCGLIYDPAEGDPDGGIPPGTAFEDIPAYWSARSAARASPTSRRTTADPRRSSLAAKATRGDRSPVTGGCCGWWPAGAGRAIVASAHDRRLRVSAGRMTSSTAPMRAAACALRCSTAYARPAAGAFPRGRSRRSARDGA